jgi:hypothetical protein
MSEPICGIYCITNKVSGEQYVGQSIDIHKRWKQHRVSFPNRKLIEAAEKHGRRSFTYGILEVCQPADLDRLEILWMCRLRPSLNNCCPDYAAYDAGTPVEKLTLRASPNREAQEARIRKRAEAPRCECGEIRTKGNRYCLACRRRVLSEMAQSGYLEPAVSLRHQKPKDRPVVIATSGYVFDDYVNR